MNKKLLLIAPLFLSLTSCQISKVNLTYLYMHESDERDDVFSHEIVNYSTFESKHTNKESFLMYIYNDKNCMCYLDLKTNSKDVVLENDLLVYTMDVKILENKNTYGYNKNNHSYPSICIFENGNLKYQVDYNQVEYFENSKKFKEYIFERISLEQATHTMY